MRAVLFGIRQRLPQGYGVSDRHPAARRVGAMPPGLGITPPPRKGGFAKGPHRPMSSFFMSKSFLFLFFKKEILPFVSFVL
jgi:hypothetical protein